MLQYMKHVLNKLDKTKIALKNHKFDRFPSTIDHVILSNLQVHWR